MSRIPNPDAVVAKAITEEVRVCTTNTQLNAVIKRHGSETFKDVVSNNKYARAVYRETKYRIKLNKMTKAERTAEVDKMLLKVSNTPVIGASDKAMSKDANRLRDALVSLKYNADAQRITEVMRNRQKERKKVIIEEGLGPVRAHMKGDDSND